MSTGLAYPIIRSGGGYFARRQYRDLIWSNIIFILTTPRGTWPGALWRGSRVHELVFEPMDDLLMLEMQNETERAINEQEPEVVAITAATQVNESTISTYLKIRLKKEPEAFEKGFVVARNQAFKVLELF